MSHRVMKPTQPSVHWAEPERVGNMNMRLKRGAQKTKKMTSKTEFKWRGVEVNEGTQLI